MHEGVWHITEAGHKRIMRFGIVTKLPIYIKPKKGSVKPLNQYTAPDNKDVISLRNHEGNYLYHPNLQVLQGS